MRWKKEAMKTGKLDIAFLQRLLKRHWISDPRVILGPKVGEDAAVIDPGKTSDLYWVVTADPITFTTEEIGYYGVVVNMNDICVFIAQSCNKLRFRQEQRVTHKRGKPFHHNTINTLN